jgi:hypothetical protein
MESYGIFALVLMFFALIAYLVEIRIVSLLFQFLALWAPLVILYMDNHLGASCGMLVLIIKTFIQIRKKFINGKF